MEKSFKYPYSGTKTLEKLREIYQQNYLELEVGEVVELSYFKNFDCQWEYLVKPEFEVFHRLNEKQTLRYTCNFENQNRVQELYQKLDDASDNDFSNIMSELWAEKLTIVARDILSEEEKFDER